MPTVLLSIDFGEVLSKEILTFTPPESFPTANFGTFMH